MNTLRIKYYKPHLGLVVIVFLLLLHLLGAFRQQLITDEWETIATARFIHEGRIIFKDFFQHHGTIPYFIYSTIFIFTESLPLTIFFMKIASFIFLCIITALLYVMAREISKQDYSPAVAFIPIFAMLNDIIWWRYSTQIRTDAIMVIFLLFSFYLFYIYQHRSLARYLIFAGVFSSAAFFTKQYSAIAILLFLLFYFRLDMRKYTAFFLGTIPITLIHVLYFFIHKTLPAFFNYFVLFNFARFPRSTFTLKERTWWFFSQATPPYIKGIYLTACILFVITSFYFYKEGKQRYGRFFIALFYSAFLTLLFAFCLKTPYPQYYMPIQILFYIIGIYYLLLLKRYKRIFVFLCTAIICILPLITHYYFKDLSAHKISLAKQTAAIEEMTQRLPKNLKALGTVPMFLICQPAGFYWYYPPIFADLNTGFLIDDLEKADIVFYDTTLYSLAPKKFKQILFNKWHFVTRFYFPFSALGRHDAVSVFVKDKIQLEQIKTNLKYVNLNRIEESLNLLDRPIYVPVYYKAELLTKTGKISIGERHFIYKPDTPEDFTLNFLITTNSVYFDKITNEVFLNKPMIRYSKIKNGFMFEIPYTESQNIHSTDWFGSIGLRSIPDNRLTYKSTIQFVYNHPPKNEQVEKLAGGYKLKLDFFTEDFSLEIDAHEKEL